MNKEARLKKIQELSSMIVDLKKSSVPNSKNTIQRLQQQIDQFIYD